MNASWPRPVPTIGDATSAAQRAGDPAGWALAPAVRAALHEVIDARRDVRRFRPDPVDDATVRRVLDAGHHGPSVGHSQPWRFLLVSDPAVRERAAVLADRERLRQAEQLDPESARRLLDLQLEGIREAPLGVVVCCDRRAPAAGVLGRATFPDTDLWSCACAIQNMWLAARAEGLGLGWVTLFRPADLAELFGLPDGVVTLGWLCLGWPDERPPAPGLERAGWSRRLPLDAVVLHDRWPAEPTSAPAPPPSRLRAPAPAAVVAARDDGDAVLTPPGSLGVLDRAVERVLALGHPGLATRDGGAAGALLIAAADHPVTRHDVSAYSVSVTREVTEAAVAGVALGATLAAGAGMAVTVVDAGVAGDPVPGAVLARVDGPRGDLAGTPALTSADTERLVAAGRRLGRELGERYPLVALGEVGTGNTTVAAALAAGLLGRSAVEVVGLGAGADAAMLERKRAVVAAALARVATQASGAGESGAGALTLLAELGGPELAVLAGAVLGAVERRAAVVLDGLAVCTAALVALRCEPGVQAGLIAGQRSREQAHALVLAELGCEPLLDLRIRAGEGAGAVLAAGLVRAALDARRSVARVHP